MQPAVSLHQVQRTRARRQLWGGARFLLPVLLTLLLGLLAYQVPFRAVVDVGELGDQLFVPSSEAQRAEQIALGHWYADQLSPEGRGRWSRERGTLMLPGLGAGSDVQLTLYAAGWPADVVRAIPQQPDIRLLVDDQVVGQFRPTSELGSYSALIPGALIEGSPLVVTLEASATFTDTLTQADARPKGIRLDAVELVAGGWGTHPDWRVLGGLGLATMLTMSLAAGRSRRSWLVSLAGFGLACVAATALLAFRLWLVAVLPTLLVGLAVLCVLSHWRWFARAAHAVQWRLRESHALDIALASSVALICLYLLARLLRRADLAFTVVAGDRTAQLFNLVLQLSVVGSAALAVVVSFTLLPRWLLDLRRLLLTTRLTSVLLGLGAGVWLGYLAWLIATLPFVGHADYADNAVVARNLLRGRGFVVDYVSQFYTLVPGGSVTRPQETWPLLQPVLMLPAMALLGPTPLAARLPNLLFLVALTLLIYHVGARIWDRRVGLLGAVLTLTNLLFFRLAIYATSDLALVVWSMAAFWLVYGAVEHPEPQAAYRGRRAGGIAGWMVNHWLWAGVFTGLMILQKPSAAVFALGMGLWAVMRTFTRSANGLNRPAVIRWTRQWLPRLLLWTGVTLVVVAPYLARNVLVFGRPFFSTEAYDAWILYFRGTRGQAWEDIYKIYTPSLGGPGLPDRSWVLRWGYDLTLGKLARQAIDAWQFFAPPKATLLSPGSRSELPYSIVGTWLMLLGLVTLHRRPRVLIGLIAAALLPYTLFLVVYWHTHDEPRYFVAFVPWLALLAAWGACWLFDRIAAIGHGRWAGLGGLVVSLALIMTIQPHWQRIDAFLDPQSSDYWGKNWDADLEAYAWLSAHTPPDAVVMTRVPWQLNFHADRPAVMIPNAGEQEILAVAGYYGADYLLINGSTTSLPESEGALQPLSKGQPPAGWVMEYRVPDRYQGADVYIYRFPDNDAGAGELNMDSSGAGGEAGGN